MAFIVYKITHTLADGRTKLYVGVTQRTTRERLSAHLNESTRKKPRGISEYSLGYAIREHLRNQAATPLGGAFAIDALQEYLSLGDMRKGESVWITALNTMAPAGYNLMRGGSSVGGPSNAKECALFLDGAPKSFPSFSEAARHVASARKKLTGKAVSRFLDTAKMRMHSGWTLAEALELEPRVDQRSTELSRQARSKGENIDTARSRKQRGVMRERRVAAGISISPLADPKNGGAPIPWCTLFEQEGVAESTGRWRLNQIASKLHAMSLDQVRAHIRSKQDRTQAIAITRPGFAEEMRGVNAWAHLMKRDGHSFSAIKARLRRAGATAGNDALLVAIGVKPAPVRQRGVVDAPPQSRKKHCSDWTIAKGSQSRKFVNQAAFVIACHTAISTFKIGTKFLGAQPADAGKAKRSLQAKITRATKKGQSPTDVATTFGILDVMLKEGAST